MKRLIPATIIFVSIIVAYILSFLYINNICKQANKYIEKCEAEYSDTGTAENTTKKLSEFWDKKEGILSVFINHDRIDGIELEISALKLYAKAEKQILFYEHIETLKMLLHQVKEDTGISVHSIL